MGYTTDFEGRFNLDKPLTPAQRAYLKRLARSRRMKRDPNIVSKFPDPLREAVGLPIGRDGEFYVGSEEMDKETLQPGDVRMPDPNKVPARWLVDEAAKPTFVGQRRDSSVLEYNDPPAGQPSLWLQWVPTDDGTAIEWDGGEKFYEYVAWLEYLVKHFIQPWGYKLNGQVEWQGEDRSDIGMIVVKDNVIKTMQGEITYKS